MRTLEEALNYATYHSPTPEQSQLYKELNARWRDDIIFIWENVQPRNQGSPDKTVAIRAILDARMKTNLAIACYVPPEQSTLPPPQGDIPAPKFSDPTSKGY